MSAVQARPTRLVIRSADRADLDAVCAIEQASFSAPWSRLLLTAELARKVNDANVLCMGESIVAPDVGCKMVEAFLTSEFQDVDGPPQDVLDFWAEARDEIMARGDEACDREMETLE